MLKIHTLEQQRNQCYRYFEEQKKRDMVFKATCKPMLCIYCNKEIHAKGNLSNKEINAGTNTLEDWDFSKIF